MKELGRVTFSPDTEREGEWERGRAIVRFETEADDDKEENEHGNTQTNAYRIQRF
jgi:hypothetical protein